MVSGSGCNLEIDGSSDNKVMREDGCGDAVKSSRDVRCSSGNIAMRDSTAVEKGSTLKLEATTTARRGSGCCRGRWHSWERLRKEGRDSGCGERATVARWQGRQMATAVREEGEEGTAGSGWQMGWKNHRKYWRNRGEVANEAIGDGETAMATARRWRDNGGWQQQGLRQGMVSAAVRDDEGYGRG
ncbi:hypothetical protein BHE74_00023187 [Ensete ventricosum]|nr:hypothetical protein GW17_00015643 [Ensete ventricosum]RWW69226.1 hypothetical protein BHE74_00023187 [Ensete ventricosum]RZS02308.1 hypothetical protein BHM03_00032349 [Ensete ventricosum]